MSDVRGAVLRMEWELESRLGAEKTLLADLIGILAGLDIRDPQADAIRTALGEACLNAAEHGHKLDSAKPVKVTMEAHESVVAFRVWDQGPGINPARLETAGELSVSLDERLDRGQLRGWGLYLISKLSDSVAAGRLDGQAYIEMKFAR